MTDKESKNELIRNKDRDLNAIKAGLKLLPAGIGEALIQLFTGNGEEARQRRLEATLEEAVQKLKEMGRKNEVEGNEDFGSFFMKAAQPIAQSTNEDKRQRFRDLLFNSMSIPPGDPAWEDSMYCLGLLQDIDAAGLYVLATIARVDRQQFAVGVSGFGTTPQWVFVPKEKLKASGVNIVAEGKFEDYRYSPVVTANSIKSLQDRNIITKRNILVTNGNYATNLDFLFLAPAAELLIKWTMQDF